MLEGSTRLVNVHKNSREVVKRDVAIEPVHYAVDDRAVEESAIKVYMDTELLHLLGAARAAAASGEHC